MTTQEPMTKSPSSWKATAIVLGSGAGLLIYNWLLVGTQVRQFEREAFHWNFSHHIFYFLIPFFAMKLASGRRRAYTVSSGFTREALLCAGLLAIPFIATRKRAPENDLLRADRNIAADRASHSAFDIGWQAFVQFRFESQSDRWFSSMVASGETEKISRSSETIIALPSHAR